MSSDRVGLCAECGSPIIMTLLTHETYDLSTLERLGVEPVDIAHEASPVAYGPLHLMVQMFCAEDPTHQHGLAWDEDGLLERREGDGEKTCR